MPFRIAIAETPTVHSFADARREHGRAGGSSKRRITWWLWPHLLSLDAPLVAVIWQGWWARSTGDRLSWAQDAILGGGVWLIYLADRLADTASTASGSHETARHAFYRQNHARMKFVATTIFLALSWLALWTLSARQFTSGLGLLALAGGYFWLVHRRATDGWARVLPKEALVAGMFALGTLFFVAGRIGVARSEMLLPGALFGGLCFFNCALITKWECKFADLYDPNSLFNAFPWLTAHLGAGCLYLALLAGACAAVGPWYGGVVLPMVISAVLLALLDRYHTRFTIDALRVLADAALLTPWLCRNVIPHL